MGRDKLVIVVNKDIYWACTVVSKNNKFLQSFLKISILLYLISLKQALAFKVCACLHVCMYTFRKMFWVLSWHSTFTRFQM